MSDREPYRVQLSRKRGWRKPENTVSVARPTKWGNPYRVGDAGWNPWYPDAVATHSDVVDAFEVDLESETGFWSERANAYLTANDVREALRGKNLACWCPLDHPCHADVLLAIANDKGSEHE